MESSQEAPATATQPVRIAPARVPRRVAATAPLFSVDLATKTKKEAAPKPRTKAHRVATGKSNAPSAKPSDALAEEKVAQRRHQYKMYQRRHRARIQDKAGLLQQQIEAIQHEIASLEGMRLVGDTLSLSASVFCARGTLAGAPAQLAREYVRLFEHGYSPYHARAQEDFLRSTMTSDIHGVAFRGVDELLQQWRLYDRFFLGVQLTPRHVQVETLDESTVVVLAFTNALRPRRGALTSLFPSIVGREDMIQELVGNILFVEGTLRYHFEPNGQLSWLGAEMNFVGALMRTLGSIEKVTLCVQDANIMSTTGEISPSCGSDSHPSGASSLSDDVRAESGSPGRFDLGYMLCEPVAAEEDE